MGKFGIVLHGGAGPDDFFIKKNTAAYHEKLKEILDECHQMLEKGKSSVDAVEYALIMMEDTELFNCGRGSAIDALGEVKMEASIMEGADRKSGGVGQVKYVKNPVKLARYVMEDSKHVLLTGEGAIDYARYKELDMMPMLYFLSEYQREMFFKSAAEITEKKLEKISNCGTVGAVALDKKGNLAAATSTGGVSLKKDGRLGDTALPGIGAYANNETCAASCTGDGEYIVRAVGSHYVSCLVEMKNMSLQDACDYMIHKKNGDIKGDFGVISIDTKGRIGVSFNSERMHRGWKLNDDKAVTKIYKNE